VPALKMNEDELIEVLQSSLYPGAMVGSVKLVINYCKAAGLDPMQKPVHIVPMWDSKAKQMRDVVMPGIGLYRTQAARSGEYAGVSEPEFGEDITEEVGGVKITFPKWCKATVRRLLPNGTVVDFTAKELWKENYATAGKDSSAPNAMWKRRPYAQLAKCAEAQALRKAFPEFGAQPTADEMEGREIDMGAAEVVGGTTNKPAAQAKELPPYSVEQMDVDMPGMASAIKSGKRTADFFLSMLTTKYTLSAEQKAAVKALERPANVDENGVIDAEFVAQMEGSE
jgi:phage recombination protein Bet